MWQERFEEKVFCSDNCWLWQAGCFDSGYGAFWLDGKLRRAHRIAYELWVGPIHEDALVCHHCDTPACVRPDHLYLGTPQSNMDDRDERGRNYFASLTHCKNGHEFTEQNTYITKQGARNCRICRSEANRGWLRSAKGRAYQKPEIVCRTCGRTRPHKGHGLCGACFERERRARQKEQIDATR